MAWTQKGQERFEADELNMAIINSLTDDEALQFMLDPSLFAKRKAQLIAQAEAQCVAVLTQAGRRAQCR